MTNNYQSCENLPCLVRFVTCLYIYLVNLKGLQRLLIFIKYIFNTKFMGLILCNSALHYSTLGDRFLNLEIPQKAKGVTLGVTGKSVTFFVRKLVQSIDFRNHTGVVFLACTTETSKPHHINPMPQQPGWNKPHFRTE